jgi:RNA recognition motif. (a.k.a. RRM, RBD, or RNP domain)
MLAFLLTLYIISDTINRFAFVEYESRRDADDAYHEMHNKRIGRDDLLKIEVG